MVDISFIMTIIQICILGLIIPLTLIYCIPLIFIRRLRQYRYAFTVNVAAAILFSSVYWLIVSILSLTKTKKPPDEIACTSSSYVQNMSTLQVSLALVLVSIHRFFSIVYHNKIHFRNKRYIFICILCQWVIGIVISLPFFIRNDEVRRDYLMYRNLG